MKFYLFIQLFMVGALLQGFGSLVGAASQNVNINKSIKAQQEENQKNRDYNLQLAKMQNEWNLQQWERENEYNNPLNQMARLKAAGLNPNLVYGNGAGQSTSAPSPSLSSGAPSSPVDMSLLAQRPTVGQIMSQALQNRSIQAQIENTEAQTKKTLADAGITEVQYEYEQARQEIGLDLMRVQFDKDKREWMLLAHTIEEAKNSASASRITLDMLETNKIFHSDKVKAELKKLENDAKISEKEAEYLVKTLSYRILGAESEANLKSYEAYLNSPELIQKLPEGIKPLISILNLIFRGH